MNRFNSRNMAMLTHGSVIVTTENHSKSHKDLSSSFTYAKLVITSTWVYMILGKRKKRHKFYFQSSFIDLITKILEHGPVKRAEGGTYARTR